MKSIDTGTIGGRIRISRQKANFNLKQMAKKIDVSPNYVSIIERNVKKPSDDLLVKIAGLTDVPFSWLKNGDKQNLDNRADKESSMSFSSGIGGTNISLFLNLVLHESSSISKETIATVLDIEEKVLDDILCGNVTFDSAWEPGLSLLAQRLEISDILKKLYGIESFLERAETQKIDLNIIKVLESYLSDSFHDVFHYVSQQHYNSGRFVDIQKSNRNTDTPVREFIFQQEATHDRWKIRMYADMYGRQLEELLFMTRFHPYRPKGDDIIVLVFSNELVFNELLYKYKYMPPYRSFRHPNISGFTEEDFFMQWEGNITESHCPDGPTTDGPASDGPTPVVLMLIDLDSMRIKEMVPTDNAGSKS